MPLALVTGATMLALWFPLSALLNQQGQLNAVRSQIGAVQRQQFALQQQAAAIDTRSAARQLAREQYQLVAPGQSLIQVLPGFASGNVAQSTGDPGLQPLVSPAAAPSLLTTPSATVTSAPVPRTQGFIARFVRILEFWR